MGQVFSMVRDGLVSLASRMGTERDKAASVFYTQPILTDEQIIAAYRGSWLPRKIVDIPALDSCRKWRNWQAAGDQIGSIDAEERRLNLRSKVLEASTKARLFGGAALFIGSEDADPALPLEAQLIGKGGIKHLTVLTRRQLAAGDIDSDPASEWYGKPRYYTLTGANGMQVTIHPSRLVIFKGAMTPNEEFGGMGHHVWGESVLAATFDAIKNADSTAANIASLVFEAKIDIIKVPQFSANIGNQAYEDAVLRRYVLANTIKGVNGTLILDSEEEYDSKSAPLSGLTDILMAFLQIVAGAADIPVTRLLGQSPAGMNATGTADMKKIGSTCCRDRRRSIGFLMPYAARLVSTEISVTGSEPVNTRISQRSWAVPNFVMQRDVIQQQVSMQRIMFVASSFPTRPVIKVLSR
jgi:phage-related protein (TIGR01555 family)